MKWSQSKHIKVVIDAVAGAMKLKLTLNESPQNCYYFQKCIKVNVGTMKPWHDIFCKYLV